MDSARSNGRPDRASQRRAIGLGRLKGGASLRERLEHLSMPVTESGCVIWLGGLIPSGYGMIYFAGKRHLAHRLSYELAKGPIPPGLELDHLCRVRCCIAPSHLEPVTRAENQRRGMSPMAQAARRDRCIRGHELAGENLYRSPDGHRHCRIYTDGAKRRHYLKNRARILAKRAAARASLPTPTQSGEAR